MKATFIPIEMLTQLAMSAEPGAQYDLGTYPPGTRVLRGDNGPIIIEMPTDMTVDVGIAGDPDADLDGVIMRDVTPLKVLMEL